MEKIQNIHLKRRRSFFRNLLLSLVLLPLVALATPEEHLPYLRVGSVVYSNVTVTTVTATTIMFNHSQGMASARLEELAPDMQARFHFDPAKASEAQKQQRAANAEFQVQTLHILRDSPIGPPIEGLPFKAVPVITAETKLRLQIRDETVALLKAKNFAGLDELARKYRRSRETFPDGTWLLGEVYDTLESSDEESDRSCLARIALFRAWTNAFPESITAHTALANELVAFGWKARGTGYMNTVSTQAYRTFVSLAQLGIMISEEAASLTEHCPFAPMPRLVAARGISARGEKFFNPLVDGIRAEPSFIYYYQEGFTYELTRWHGMAEDSAEAFLKRYSDKMGGDEGDVLYARVAWLMQCSGMFSDVMKECHLSWNRVDKGFQVLERRYPDALSVKSAHALLGGFAGGQSVARTLIEKLEGKVDGAVWQPLAQFKEHVRFAYAMKQPGQTASNSKP